MSDSRTVADQQADLVDMFEMFNQTTQRLQSAHDTLQHEVRQLTDELEQKNMELMRKNRLAALGEMAAGIAHEIRNPLGGIQLYTSLLIRDLAAAEPKSLAQKINLGVHTINRIVEDVLAFAREVTPDLSRCDLNGVIDQVVLELETQALQADVQIVRQLQISDPIVPADAGLLQRAVANVVLNAIQASEPGGTVVVQTGEGLRNGPFVSIQVTDSGSGLKEETLDKIFNPFFTDKDAGTGLGLAIVHRIMESHGGSVTASNTQDGGASFTLKLPRGTDPNTTTGNTLS